MATPPEQRQRAKQLFSALALTWDICISIKVFQ